MRWDGEDMNSGVRRDYGYERRKAEFKRQYIKKKRRKRIMHNAIVISIWMFMALILVVLGIKTIDHFIPKLNDTNEAQEVNKNAGEANKPVKDDTQAPPSGKEESLLSLVNKEHQLAKDYVPQLVQCYRTIVVDHRMGDSLVALVDEANKNGISIYVASGYRTFARQEELYKEKADADQAGQSEHELGLAVDIASDAHMDQDQGFAKTKEFTWVQQHCAEYGFIIRYPKGKEKVTGHEFEPWHLRYVGKEDAKSIMKQGIALEEYKNK